jgi:hypothetical protein
MHLLFKGRRNEPAQFSETVVDTITSSLLYDLRNYDKQKSYFYSCNIGIAYIYNRHKAVRLVHIHDIQTSH